MNLAGGREEMVVKGVEQPIRSFVGLERAPVVDKQPDSPDAYLPQEYLPESLRGRAGTSRAILAMKKR